MFIETAQIRRTTLSATPSFRPNATEQTAGLRREQGWRQPCLGVGTPDQDAVIFASRWTDDRATARQERCHGAPDRYIVAVALRPVRARFGRGSNLVVDGILHAGTIHVTEPGQLAEAEFFAPCDFIHFHVAADYLHEWHRGTAGSEARSLHDLVVRDALAGPLARTLVSTPDGGDPRYIQSVGQTILMRALASRPGQPRVGVLPKWRLRRVQEHVAVNLAEPISLAELAGVAGLSRMHFAAQFKVATGCRPHEFLLQYRIEAAKRMLTETNDPLVEVALNVGFQTQSHFSTVFKRLVGETPARWQRAQVGQ